MSENVPDYSPSQNEIKYAPSEFDKNGLWAFCSMGKIEIV